MPIDDFNCVVRRLTAAVGLLLLVCGRALADPVPPSPPLSAQGIAVFLQRHTGPVLDVRKTGDCAPELRRTSANVPFDHDFNDRDMQRIAAELFIEELRDDAILNQALRDGRLILVVCCFGVRSRPAVDLMAAHGYVVVTVTGGVAAAVAVDPALAR